MKKVGFLAVSFVALMSVGAARADIASTTYVANAVAPKEATANKVKSTEALDTLKTSETRYPSMAAANKIAQTYAQAAVSGAAASYQVKSTAAYQMGDANGAWTTMSKDQQNALNSKVTAAKVTTYDGYATTIANKQDKSTAVTHTVNTAAGDSTHPVYVNASGVATKIDKVAAAANADAATKATQDASGNTITTTYATKSQMNAVKLTAEGKQDALIAGANITITKDPYNGKTTIASTGPTYTLPTATASRLGGVKAGSNVTIADDGTISTHAPVTPGNGTVTIKQGGVSKGTFTLNQSGAATIELTDADTKYTLTAATANALGGVKSGGNITVATDGTVTVNQAANATNATNATSATKATQDASGNVITATYATKTENNEKLATSTYTSQIGSVSAANMGTTATTVVGGIKEAVTEAAAAQSTADTAKANAATAQSTADTAKANAATAQSKADSAYTLANAAIPKPSGSCKDCVLKYNGTAFSWEEIGR